MYLGSHLTVSPSYQETIGLMESLGCSCVQIFAQNPRCWQSPFKKDEEIKLFTDYLAGPPRKPLFLHGQYLINLSSSSTEIREKSGLAIREGMRRATALKTDNQLFHPGTFRIPGREKGLSLIAEALARLLDEDKSGCCLVLENGAGQYAFGSRLSDFRFILEKLGWSERIKICLDTCHSFASGYDWTAKEGFKKILDELAGLNILDRIELFHLNDSKGKLGSGIDRHTHIGKGYIGLGGFENILTAPEFFSLSFIIETPKDSFGNDARNLEILRKLAGYIR